MSIQLVFLVLFGLLNFSAWAQGAGSYQRSSGADEIVEEARRELNLGGGREGPPNKVDKIVHQRESALGSGDLTRDVHNKAVEVEGASGNKSNNGRMPRRNKIAFSILYNSSPELELVGNHNAPGYYAGWSNNRSILFKEYFNNVVGLGIDFHHLFSERSGISIGGEYFNKSEDKVNDAYTIQPYSANLYLNHFIPLHNQTKLKLFFGAGYSDLRYHLKYSDGRHGSIDGNVIYNVGAGIEFPRTRTFVDIILRKGQYEYSPPDSQVNYSFDIRTINYEAVILKAGFAI